jgi:hypothetical protein
MSKSFENEVFESDETLPDPAEELRQKTVGGLYADAVPYDRETGEVLPEPAKPAVRLVKASGARVKRTEQQMIAALGGSALKKATYAAERISKLEDKITELMGAIGPEARQLILNDFPHLNRY